MQNFPKIAKTRCREICDSPNREINMSRKFHVIRYVECKCKKVKCKTNVNNNNNNNNDDDDIYYLYCAFSIK